MKNNNMKITRLAIAILMSFSITLASPSIAEAKELEIEAPKVEIEQEADHSDLIRNVTAISLAAIIGGISVGKARHKRDERPKIKEKKNK